MKQIIYLLIFFLLSACTANKDEKDKIKQYLFEENSLSIFITILFFLITKEQVLLFLCEEAKVHIGFHRKTDQSACLLTGTDYMEQSDLVGKAPIQRRKTTFAEKTYYW